MNNITGKQNVGGIAGGVAQANIKYCYNNSTINANETAAGIVGLQVPFNSNDYTNNSIWYCYNIGNIIGNVRTGSIAGAIRYYSCDYVYGLYGTASDTASEVQNYKGDGSHFGMLNKSDLISMVLTNYDSKFKEDTLNKNKGYPILNWQN